MKVCDIFLMTPQLGSSKPMKRLHNIYDKSLVLSDDKVYSGFLGLNLNRISAVSVVVDFRDNKCVANSVPIEYRDSKLISFDEALLLVSGKYNLSMPLVFPFNRQSHPMYWKFLIEDHNSVGEGGGVVLIDKLDGHEWGGYESAEYEYDFNNRL